MATRRGYEEKENIKGAYGHAAEDEPHPGLWLWISITSNATAPIGN